MGMSIDIQKIHRFKDLIVWQKAHNLAIAVYGLTKTFPREEQFGLTNQIRRAVVSIASNIAEGFGRNTAKDKNQFYAIAKGSTLEIDSQLLIAKDLGYIKDTEHHKLEQELETIARMLAGLSKSSIDK